MCQLEFSAYALSIDLNPYDDMESLNCVLRRTNSVTTEGVFLCVQYCLFFLQR